MLPQMLRAHAFISVQLSAGDALARISVVSHGRLLDSIASFMFQNANVTFCGNVSGQISEVIATFLDTSCIFLWFVAV